MFPKSHSYKKLFYSIPGLSYPSHYNKKDKKDCLKFFIHFIGEFKMQKLFNVSLLILLSLILLVSVNERKLFSILETKELIIKNPSSSSYMRLSADTMPTIGIYDAEGRARLEITGGIDARITFKDPKGVITSQWTEKEILLLSAKEKCSLQAAKLIFPKLHLEGGATPGIYLSGPQNTIIGSWTVLSDGGSGIGFANAAGEAAAIVRGGSNPSLAFFASGDTPMTALGIANSIPSFFLNNNKNEGVLIHGGQPTGVMFMDESGAVKILISKEGLFQQKETPTLSEPKPKEKLFTYEDDYQKLFNSGSKK